MTTAMLEKTGDVVSTHLSDGMIVRLSGSVTHDQLPALRLALLTPLPESCRDVVVDAGDLLEVADPAVAVLLAARDWAESHGARFLLSRSAACLNAVLTDAGIPDALPRLADLGRVAPAIPMPRRSAD
jgi:hypothetical protein